MLLVFMFQIFPTRGACWAVCQLRQGRHRLLTSIDYCACVCVCGEASGRQVSIQRCSQDVDGLKIRRTSTDFQGASDLQRVDFAALQGDMTCSTRAQSKETGDEEMPPGLFLDRLHSRERSQPLYLDGTIDGPADCWILLDTTSQMMQRAWDFIVLLCGKSSSARCSPQ